MSKKFMWVEESGAYDDQPYVETTHPTPPIYGVHLVKQFPFSDYKIIKGEFKKMAWLHIKAHSFEHLELLVKQDGKYKDGFLNKTFPHYFI